MERRKRKAFIAGGIGEEIVVCDLRLLVGFRSFTGRARKEVVKEGNLKEKAQPTARPFPFPP